MPDAAGKAYWESIWGDLPAPQLYEGPVFEQHAVLAPFLSAAGSGEAIEVGCVPGNWLVYLSKEFGYRVSGIDYSGRLEYVRENLRLNGIEPVELFQADIFNFFPGRCYDLVFSAGFVEHFDEHELVVQKHAELAKPGGLVVIMVPNLTHVHRILGAWFHPEMMKAHRLTLMHQKTLLATLERAGLTVLHCAYTKTFRPVYKLPFFLDIFSRGLQKSLRLMRLDNIGNRFASPYLVSVSRKPLQAGAGRPAGSSGQL